MQALGECFEQEPDAFIRAVFGHWLFGFIHLYMDGNGRLARFSMNLILASGGYPRTVIYVEDRGTDMDAFEKPDVDSDLTEFSSFMAKCVKANV